MRFCLLQARNLDDPTREEERGCFARRLEVDVEAIVCVDMLHARPTRELWQDFDAILVGGAGEYSALDHHPGIEATMAFLGATARAGRPLFASCFGFQLLSIALGGQVVHDEENAEVGTFHVSLTDEGLRDPLFGSLPARFLAQEGHKDRASVLPPGVVHLAGSERAPFQAFRMPGAPVYATQFHPELDRDDQRLRFMRYFEMYKGVFGAGEAEAMLEGFEPSPEACSLLVAFRRSLG